MNPGLKVFAGPTTYVHPRMEDIRRGDPDFDPEEEEGEGSDWVPFSGWRREHGQPLRTTVGPAFKPGETPEDVIHGEVVSPEEQDAADHIINGDHESDQPSDNPHVEKARQDLHTDAANDTVHTLSDLLSGGSPEDVGGLDEAHDYLSSRFTGVRVNPIKGTLMAQSPAGTQIVKRKMNLPAVRREKEAPPPEPTYTLTNKHGTFESDNPHRIVRAMVAFNLIQNEIEKDKDKDKSLALTSGFREFMGDLGGVTRNTLRALKPSPGLFGGPEPKPEPYKPVPRAQVPRNAIFEPGRGEDVDENGQPGGWVAYDSEAPSHWKRDDKGIAYSPGHDMMNLLDQHRAMDPQADEQFPGHTFTYAPNPYTGHIVERHGGGARYFVTPLHPAFREDIDVPKRPKKPKDKPAGTIPTPGSTAPVHSRPLSLGPTGQQPQVPPKTSAANMNDLCPVCASGYLEPYDSTYHECLNCGTLVKHVGFEKSAALKDDPTMEFDTCPQCGSMEVFHRPSDEPEAPNMGCDRCGHDWYDDKQPVDSPDAASWFFDKFAARRKPGGLGRGLKDIEQPEATKSQSIMDLAGGGSQDPNRQDEPLPSAEYHPLHGEINQTPEEERYVAPKRIVGSALYKQAEAEPITLDEHLGKFGFTPHHKAGGPRLYASPMPGTRDMFMRLTEGVPHPKTGETGWTLTADTFPAKEPFTTPSGKPMRGGLPLERTTKDPVTPGKKFNQPLPDLTNRLGGESTRLAHGFHPVHDTDFARAIADMAVNGRDSETYWNAINHPHTPPPAPMYDPFLDQRGNRMLSSVQNPGLDRFTSVS